MKNIYLLIAFILYFSGSAFAQVGINSDGTAAHSSAMLDVKSGSKGFLPPRMTTAQRNSIVSPAAGLVIFNTDCVDLQYYNGGAWVPMSSRGQLTTPTWINGDFDPCIGQSGLGYEVSTVPGANAYQWTVPPGSVIVSGQGSNAITVDFGLTPGNICVTALDECDRSQTLCQSVTFLPWPDPATAVLMPDANPSCAGATVNIYCNVSYSGFINSYQWYRNNTLVPGVTWDTYSFVPANGDVVFCKVSTWEQCWSDQEAFSDTVTLSVNPSTPVSISIAASANNVCTGRQVTFTATPVNGGASPSYQWKKNGSNISGATNPTYTYAPANNDIITCVLTSSISCPSGSPATSNAVTMTVQSSQSKAHVAGTVAPVNKTVTYGLVSNISGEPAKCWITRNLGASQQATVVSDATEASAGWYWQFNRKQGRKHDGTTLTPAWTTTSINENSNWTAAEDPCTIELGSPWRIPTLTEWTNVDNAYNWTTWSGPFSSALKIHAAGNLGTSNGALSGRGSAGYYWSSAQNSNTTASALTSYSADCSMNSYSKPVGFTVRCIKE